MADKSTLSSVIMDVVPFKTRHHFLVLQGLNGSIYTQSITFNSENISEVNVIRVDYSKPPKLFEAAISCPITEIIRLFIYSLRLVEKNSDLQNFGRKENIYSYPILHFIFRVRKQTDE